MAAYKILGIDYFKELAKLNPAFTRDQRLQVDWVTRGKYPIAIGASSDNVWEFKKAGVPMEQISVKEGSYLTASGGTMVILSNAPHPNAAKIFLNFLASKEGQDIWTEHEGVQSARVDATTTGLDPGAIRQPNTKVLNNVASALNRGLKPPEVSQLKLAVEL